MGGGGGGLVKSAKKDAVNGELEAGIILVAAIVSVSDFYVPSFLVEVVRK